MEKKEEEKSVVDFEPVIPVTTVVVGVPVKTNVVINSAPGLSDAQRKDINTLDSMKNFWDRRFALASDTVKRGEGGGEPVVAFCKEMMREMANWMGKKDLMNISLTLI